MRAIDDARTFMALVILPIFLIALMRSLTVQQEGQSVAKQLHMTCCVLLLNMQRLLRAVGLFAHLLGWRPLARSRRTHCCRGGTRDAM